MTNGLDQPRRLPCPKQKAEEIGGSHGADARERKPFRLGANCQQGALEAVAGEQNASGGQKRNDGGKARRHGPELAVCRRRLFALC